jgi:hypothetical protein
LATTTVQTSHPSIATCNSCVSELASVRFATAVAVLRPAVIDTQGITSSADTNLVAGCAIYTIYPVEAVTDLGASLDDIAFASGRIQRVTIACAGIDTLGSCSGVIAVLTGISTICAAHPVQATVAARSARLDNRTATAALTIGLAFVGAGITSIHSTIFNATIVTCIAVVTLDSAVITGYGISVFITPV